MTIKSLGILFTLFLWLSMATSYGQSTDAVRAPLAEGHYWKDYSIIQSTLQSELTASKTILNNPKTSDKNKGIMIGYIGLMNQFIRTISPSSNFDVEIEKAFDLIKNEDVGIPYKRALIINDIFIKKEELILKLTTK